MSNLAASGILIDSFNVDSTNTVIGIKATALAAGTPQTNSVPSYQQDGTVRWAVAGTVTSVAMTVPASFNIQGSPILGQGTLALSWSSSGLVPTANLGNGNATSSNFLSGDSTWKPVITTFRAISQPALTGDVTLAAGSNVSLAQSGNTITITSTGGGGGGSGTVTSVTSSLNAFTFVNSTINPALTIQNASAPTTQFLRADGTWAVPAGGSGGVSQVTLAVPTGFAVSGSPGTGNVALAISYAGQIPASSLGAGTPSNTNYLRGDSTWQPVVSGIQTPGQPIVSGTIVLAAGNNISLSQSGNTINIIGTGGGGGGTVTSVTSSLNAFTFTNSTINPVLTAQNATTPTTQFLRADGIWAVPAGGSSGVSQVALTVPTGFAVSGSPGTGNVSLSITYSGQIPPTNLGVGTPANINFLRGDSSWQPVVSGIHASGQQIITGVLTITAGNNISLAQSGNTITITGAGGGGGGTVTSVTSSLNAFTFTNSTINPVLTTQNVTSASTQFLRADGLWAVPAGGSSGVSQVALTVPTGFSVSGSPGTGNVTLAITYSGLIPQAQLGTGTPSSTNFLRGDGTWAVPSGGGGGVSQVSLTVPTGFAVSGTPGTGNVALAISYSGQIPVANLGTGTANTTTYLRGDGSWQPAVASVAKQGSPVRTGAIQFVQGANMTITDNGDGSFTFASTGGGGGGGFSSVSAVWTGANAVTKDAYTGPGNINNDGITLRLVATSNPGALANATIALNGTNLSGTFTVTGTFPNYTITVPASSLAGNAAEIAATVTIGVVIGTQFNLTANNLNNRTPIPFTATLTAVYTPNVLPFYTTLASLRYAYNWTGDYTFLGGSILLTGATESIAASEESATVTNNPINGGFIQGLVRGVGQYGAGSVEIPLTGSVSAATTYVPAFYAQTATSTPPSFIQQSSQTTGAAQGSTINYPLATARTQYNWICTQRPLSSLILVTPIGSSVLVPDVTGPTQTISGQTFNVYGWTLLSTVSASVLQVN